MNREKLRYFPLLVAFRIEHEELIHGWRYKWLTDAVNQIPGMNYARLLWVEAPDERQARQGRQGDTLGWPVLVIAIEDSGSGPMLGLFGGEVLDGASSMYRENAPLHSTYGDWQGSDEDFRTRARAMADDILAPRH